MICCLLNFCQCDILLFPMRERKDQIPNWIFRNSYSEPEHEDDLIVAVKAGVGVGAHKGVRVRVDQGGQVTEAESAVLLQNSQCTMEYY